MAKVTYVVERYGNEFLAHRSDCDCLADDAQHGVADTAVGALRKLLKEEVA